MKIIALIPQWMLMIFFFVGLGTEPFCSTTYPYISADLGVGEIEVQNCATLFFLGFGIGMFLLGRISDRTGRRPVLIFGFVVYFITAVITIFINDIYTFLCLRFIQGIGCSVGSVISHSMARDSYRNYDLAKVYANLGVVFAITTMLSSIIGNFIVSNSSWRYNFVALSVISFAIVIISYLKLPETNPYIGHRTSKAKYSDVLKMMLKDRKVMLYTLIVGQYLGMKYAFIGEAPFFNQNRGISSGKYDLIMLCIVMTNLLGTWLNRKMVEKYYDPNRIMMIGLFCSGSGCLLFLVIHSIIQVFNIDIALEHINIIAFYTAFMLHTFGYSMVATSILRIAIQHYSKVSGTAGSIFGGGYFLVVTILQWVFAFIPSTHIYFFLSFMLMLSLINITSALYLNQIKDA